MLAMLSGAVMAQTTFTLKLGGAFPMGDFADAKVTNTEPQRWGLFTKHTEGGAGTGFNLGVEWKFAIPSVKGLGVALSFDGFYNGLNEDLNDMFEDMLDEMDDEFDDYSMTTPSYINVPVMVGVNYKYDINNMVGLYAAAGMGLNMRFVTPMRFDYEYHDYDYDGDRYTVTTENTIKWDMAASFAFRLTAGVTFAQKYSIEIGYYNLGAGKVKGNVKELSTVTGAYSDSESYKEKERLKSITPELFTLRLGLSF